VKSVRALFTHSSPLFTFCSGALRSGEFAISQNDAVKSGEERVKRYK
jgi:hypothetical protein